LSLVRCSPYRITLVRADPNYGERFHKGGAAAHYLKAYLRRHSRARHCIDVTIVTLNSCWPNAADLNAQWILSRLPALIGFSCYCWNVDTVIRLAQLLKDLCADVVIVAGGPEVSFCAQDFLRCNDAFDMVVRGEGEATFCKLVDRLAAGDPNFSEIAGLTYRSGNSIVTNPDRPLIADLDDIPSPFMDGTVDLAECDGEVMLETVRGCPFRCTYCLHTKGVTGVRSFSWRRIESEIVFLCCHPAVRVIWFADPTFDADEQRASSILELVRKVNPAQGVAFELRAETLSEEIIHHLQQLNVVDVGIGLQTTNPTTLQLLRRPSNLECFQANLRALASSLRGRTRLDVDVIYGLPGDAFEDYQRTVQFGLHLGGHLYYQPLRVFRGAEISRQAPEFGLRYMSSAPHNILRCGTFSSADMVRAYQLNAGLDFYQSPAPMVRESMEAVGKALVMPIHQTCVWLGELLWRKGLRHYFRVSNATPDDIPVQWRVLELIAALEAAEREGAPLSETSSRLRRFIREAGDSEFPRSGYYHAAI